MKLITKLRMFEDSIKRGTLKDADIIEYYYLRDILNSYGDGFTINRQTLDYLLNQLKWDSYGFTL